MNNNNITNNNIYINHLKEIAALDLGWEKLKHKRILIIGATGMIGSCLIDVLMHRNKVFGDGIEVIAMSRNYDRAQKRFLPYWKSDNFKYIQYDCQQAIPESVGLIDIAIQAASNTHPMQYSNDPIGTIMTNILGISNLLEYLKNQKSSRTLFISSVEIYGENINDIESFSEKDLGYIDCNTMRAGYPESKRVSESLCQSYISKYNMDIVIARLCRVFGPTMLENDSKALSQFINKAVNNEDIVLKSEGQQYFSYIYVFDAVSALLTIINKGKTGEAYNIADTKSNITLKELAETIAQSVGKKVIFELPSNEEKKGYSTATKAILNYDKLSLISWPGGKPIKENLKECINILKDIRS